MPKSRAKSRKRGGGRRRNYTMGFEEAFTFSVQNGASTYVTIATLANRPPRSNFRPVWLEVEACGYVPSSSATEPASFAPVGIQIGIAYGSVGSSVPNEISVSPIHTVTNVPRRVRVFNRRSEDWITFDQPANTNIAVITAVCTGSVGTDTSAYLRGTARMRFAIQTEAVASACPTYHLSSDDNRPLRPPTAVEELDLTSLCSDISKISEGLPE